MAVPINIRIGVLPNGLVAKTLPVGKQTVADAIEIAQLNPSGYQIRVDGTPANLDEELRDGQTVTLLQNIKGNS